MLKWIRKNKVKTILIGLGTFTLTLLCIAYTSDTTPAVGEFSDTPDQYDDKEFYELTHNTDGSLNDYGKSLDN